MLAAPFEHLGRVMAGVSRAGSLEVLVAVMEGIQRQL